MPTLVFGMAHTYIYIQIADRDKYKCGGEQKKKGRQTERLIAS